MTTEDRIDLIRKEVMEVARRPSGRSATARRLAAMLAGFKPITYHNLRAFTLGKAMAGI